MCSGAPNLITITTRSCPLIQGIPRTIFLVTCNGVKPFNCLRIHQSQDLVGGQTNYWAISVDIGVLFIFLLTGPYPFIVTEGEEIDLIVRFSSDSTIIQFGLQRVPKDGSVDING